MTSALALSNVSINDEYVLTDKLSPRQFSELVGIDREVVEVLYMAYAYNQEQYGPVVTGIDDYDVPILGLFLIFRFLLKVRRYMMHWRKFEKSLHNIIQKTVLFL